MGRSRTGGGPEPVRAVYREVHGPPDASGYQFVDGGIDRGVLAPDPHSGQEPEHEEEPGVTGPSERWGLRKQRRR
jgi:hypothetical protein